MLLVPRRCAWMLLAAACSGAPPSGPVATRDSDLRPQFAAFGLPPRAQGPRPTCSIFTTVAAIEFACARARGRGERLSVDYLNWAGNAATGRGDDGDFFHTALAGYERYGICRELLQPYASAFRADAVPPPDALVDAGRLLAETGGQVHVRWIRPNDGTRGLGAPQLDDVVQTLASGWPVAAGAGHSRLLVGYRSDANAAGGGTFTTLDSGLGAFGEVTAAFVRDEVCDAFVVSAEGPAAAR